MAAPLSWLRDAIAKRDQVAERDGVVVSVWVDSEGVQIFAPGSASLRSWDDLDAATSNPLVPTVETIAARVKRAKVPA
jgi:hypothetical protein